MSNTCVASTSRQSIEFNWKSSIGCSPFPTSDIRLECRSQPATLAPTNPHRQPGSVARDHPSEHQSITCYPTSSPRRVEIQRGVWFDGIDTVLSATFPDVGDFLANARNTLSLPTPSSEIIFTLAALDVFYNPGDPAHWLFWSDEKKYETAKVVTRIALHRPPLIHSSVTWNGTPEYLFILANRHGSTWRQLYETQIWYPVLVPPKIASPARVLNLRKRKPAQLAMRDLSPSPEDEDIENPPPKRTRIRGRNGSNKKPVLNDVCDVAGANSKGDESPSSECSSLPLEDAQPDDDISTLPTNANNVDESPSTRASVRQRERGIIRGPSASSESSRSSSPIPCPPPISTPPAVYSRNRSISQASAETLVGHQRRRSLSSISADTTVEFVAPKDMEMLGEGVVVTTDTTDDSTAAEPVVSAMVTRGRAKGARAIGGSKNSHVGDLEAKMRPIRSRGANPSVRSRRKQPSKTSATKT